MEKVDLCLYINIYLFIYLHIRSSISSVGIATRYSLAGLRSNPGGGDIYRTGQRHLGPTLSITQWVQGHFRGKYGRELVLTTHVI